MSNWLNTSFICLLSLLSLSIVRNADAQTPTFGPPIDVTINGWNDHAAEPFVTTDGNIMIYNNDIDWVNTKMFYATRVNDSTWNYVNEAVGANQTTPPHLDGAPTMDSLNNFFWTTDRDYPQELDNMMYGTWNNGTVTDIGRVRGDFNLNQNGWWIIDQSITPNGQRLYYNHAEINTTCSGVCNTDIGVAERVNDSTFNRLANTVSIFQNINNPNYRNYVPYITGDELEIYYTRYPAGPVTSNTLLEMCVATRPNPTANFAAPVVLFAEPLSSGVEAPTLTLDKQIMYYHQRTPGFKKIVMRYRTNNVSVEDYYSQDLQILLFPNPSNGDISINISGPKIECWDITLIDALGAVCFEKRDIRSSSFVLNTNELSAGIYYVRVSSRYGLTTRKILLK